MKKLKGLTVIGYISLEKGSGKIYQKRSTMRAIDTRTKNLRHKKREEKRMENSQKIMEDTVKALLELR